MVWSGMAGTGMSETEIVFEVSENQADGSHRQARSA